MTQPPTTLQRQLQTRHLTMIAIGGSIGTGLFLASGTVIATSGLWGATLAYLLIGSMVYFLMTSLAELSAFMPAPGAFSLYGQRFIDPAFGFALGWNYWYNWAITVCMELLAASLVMRYWFPGVPAVFWCVLFLLLMVLVNGVSVRGFGESEYWFSWIKVITVLLFLSVGCCYIVTSVVLPSCAPPHWGRALPYFVGGGWGLFHSLLQAGFTFQGTELVGVAAGESEDPRHAIPRAIKQVFWRILLFYVGTIVVIGCCLPHDHPHLLKSSEAEIGFSPFTLIFEQVTGSTGVASVMNGVILTAILSAGISGMYAATRVLYALAKQRMAPACFGTLSRQGIPIMALYATVSVAMLSLFSFVFESQTLCLWLLNASSMAGFLAWLGIAWAHYRFRRALAVQGIPLTCLPYRARFYPFGPLYALGMSMLVIVGQGVLHLADPEASWASLAAIYALLPVFALLWFGYRCKYGTQLVPYAEISFEPADF